MTKESVKFEKLKERTRRGSRGGVKKVPVEVVEQELKIYDDDVTEVAAAAAAAVVEPKVKRKRGKRAGKEESILKEEEVKSYPEEIEEIKKPLESTELPALASDIKNYLISIEKTLKADKFEDDGDRHDFLRNVYREIQDHEAEMAGDVDGSRILELLLLLSNDFHVRVFFTAIKSEFEALSCNQFASHVIETLLNVAAEISHRECEGTSIVETEAALDTIVTLVVETCNDLSSRWEMLSKHRYGSHVFRTLLTVLCPLPKSTTKALRSNKSKDFQKRVADQDEEQSYTVPTLKAVENRTVPKEFTKKISEIATTMSEIDQRVLRQLAIHQVASPLLQVRFNSLPIHIKLLIPHSPLLSQKLLFDMDLHTVTDFIYILAQDRAGSHLLECIIPTLSTERFDKVFKILMPRIIEYSHHALSNFCVQSLIKSSSTESHASTILKSLEKEFKVLFKYRSGVVIALSAMCVAHPTLQPQFFSALMTSLGCDKIDLFSKTIRLATPNPNLQGSLMLQNILSFTTPIANLFVHSFIATNESITLSFDQQASRCIESLFKSSNITRELKDKASQVFTDQCVKLASDKSGSHVLDAVFAGCSTEIKSAICDELIIGKLSVQKSYFGRFCLANCKVEEYERSYQMWEDRQNGKIKKANMFEDIINDGDGVPESTKKQKKVKTPSLDKIFFPVEESEANVKAKDTKRKAVTDDSMDFLMDAITATKKMKK